VILNSLRPYLRLSLFLALSAGMHGSLASYDWTASAEQAGSRPAPLLVSLLPATAAAPAVTTPATHPPLDQPPVVQPSSPPENKPPRLVPKTAKPVPVAVPVKSRPERVLPGKKLPVVAPVESPAGASTMQAACMVPQEVVPTGRPVGPGTVADSSPGEPFTRPDAGPAPVSGPAPAENGALVAAVPSYSSNPLPEYPFLARRKHWQGVVWLLVDVSRDGLVEGLRVEQSCGHGILDRAASRTVRRWRFIPARRAGQPTASQVRIPVRFQLEDS
jgi:protein TonB